MNFNYNSPIFNKINIPNIQFRSFEKSPPKQIGTANDSFVSNPIVDNFTDKNVILNIAKSNPNIMRILQENNLKLNINPEELKHLQEGHLKNTRIITAKMYSALPEELKTTVSLEDIQQAAMFHDYGKIFIPDKILNKKGQLDPQEKKIMELHSELGAELLSKQGLSKNVLDLIKYHHQNSELSGYPQITDDYIPNISSQILAAADKYSALTEKRSYKEALSRNEALRIIKQDSKFISPEVFDALVKATG